MVPAQHFSTFYHSTFLSFLLLSPLQAFFVPFVDLQGFGLYHNIPSIVTLGVGDPCYSSATQPLCHMVFVLYLSPLCFSSSVVLVILKRWFKCPGSHSKALRIVSILMTENSFDLRMRIQLISCFYTCSYSFNGAKSGGLAYFISTV